MACDTTKYDAVRADFSYPLAVTFGVFATICVVQFVRFHYVNKLFTPQKAIHIILGLVCIARTVFFARAPEWCGVYFFVKSSHSTFVMRVLSQSASFAFIAAYAIVVQLWASVEMTHSDNMKFYKAWFKPMLWAFIATVTLAQLAAWIIGGRFLAPETLAIIVESLRAFSFCVLAVLFSVYSCRIRGVLEGVPYSVGMRMNKIRELQVTGYTCTICFLMRALIMLVAEYASETNWMSVNTSFTWKDGVIFAVYYVLFELMPIAVILYFQRVVPPPVVLTTPLTRLVNTAKVDKRVISSSVHSRHDYD